MLSGQWPTWCDEHRGPYDIPVPDEDRHRYERLVIGLAGKARSGKDTAADILGCKSAGVPGAPFMRMAFVDPLKVSARSLGWAGK